MIEENIFKFEDRLNSPLRRFTDKSFVPVRYWHIKADQTTTDAGFGDVAEILGKESPIRFQVINNLPLYGLDSLILNINTEDQGLDSQYEGEAIIMAGTLKPLQNDYFMITHLHDAYIFRVTGVEYDTAVMENCYKINYMLEYIDNEEAEHLQNQTVGEYTCIMENIGTEDRCIIESDENEKLKKIDAMYDEICNAYITFFYNERYNCFLADFENEKKLFDPLQLEFIKSHQLFHKKAQIDSLFLTEQFEDPKRKIKYQKSIYRFFETRKLDKINQFKYITFNGSYNNQTAFYRWIDRTVEVLDIPKIFDPSGLNTYAIMTPEMVESIRLNGPVDNKTFDLIQRYARKEELTIDDIDLGICDEIMDLDDANLQVFFFVPIILFIIKEIVSENLHREFTM
jgi:hypothetical protein